MPVNPLTEWLASRYPEASPLDFYSDMFPEASLGMPGEWGAYEAVGVRITTDSDGVDHPVRIPVSKGMDGLSELLRPGAQAIMSPVTYAGRRPLLDHAHELFAVVFDLDGVNLDDDGDGPCGLVDLVYQAVGGGGADLFPMPTYIASSGTGLHLYYVLSEPLRLWPNVCEALAAFRHAMTRRIWNPYVTSLHQEVQYEAVNQGFRMVGSRSKSGDQVVRAFRTGGRTSMDELNGFVPEGCRVGRELYEARHGLEEARELWPEWDPEWRRKAMLGPKCPWRVKRDLYDWWVRRVEAGEISEGHRYWALFTAAAYASKCPDVTYEELEAWAYGIRRRLDHLTTRKGNAFTAQHVADALSAYGDPLSVKLRRDKIAKLAGVEMPVNKRNGREQEVHLAVARAIQKVTDPNDGWRNKSGRPKGSRNKSHPKRDAVCEYAASHPEANHSQIARALGVSRPTVIKWLRDA